MRRLRLDELIAIGIVIGAAIGALVAIFTLGFWWLVSLLVLLVLAYLRWGWDWASPKR